MSEEVSSHQVVLSHFRKSGGCTRARAGAPRRGAASARRLSTASAELRRRWGGGCVPALSFAGGEGDASSSGGSGRSNGQWFNDNLDVKTQALVRGFVVANISEKIRKHELENIRQNRENSVDEDFTIKIIGDDVLCKYVFQGDDDIVLEMEIKLPNDYPVTAAKVNLSGKTGVDAKRERAWHFRLSVLLSKAEKSIIESLESWRKLVDIEFQGVEACAICYSVVFGGASGNTKELPKICCKQCNHKYHSKCIYKWFQTSNNNTCPLCRSPMIFS